MSTDTRNPFDDPDGTFLVLDNGRGELSMWPEFAAVPAGWHIVFGPGTLTACAADVEERWDGTLRPGRPALSA